MIGLSFPLFRYQKTKRLQRESYLDCEICSTGEILDTSITKIVKGLNKPLLLSSEINLQDLLNVLFQNENGSFLVPYEAELQTKRHCIVYDSRTESLNDQGIK